MFVRSRLAYSAPAILTQLSLLETFPNKNGSTWTLATLCKTHFCLWKISLTPTATPPPHPKKLQELEYECNWIESKLKESDGDQKEVVLHAFYAAVGSKEAVAIRKIEAGFSEAEAVHGTPG